MKEGKSKASTGPAFSQKAEQSPSRLARNFLAKSHESLLQEVKDEWEGKERRRLRLVIAIPSLMVLITLSAGIIGYEFVLDIADHTDSNFLKNQMEHAADSILLANFIACGIALFFGLGLATYIVRPIRVITQKARTIATGDLSMKVKISNPDEIGDLGDSFNSLVDHLNHLFKERDRYILEGFSEGLVSIGAKGEILAINTQAEKILDLRADHVIGKEVDKVFGGHKENTEIHDLLVASLQTHTRLILDKISYRNPQGHHYDLSVITSPIRDQRGNLMGCILSLRDLSILAPFAEKIKHADRLAAIGSFATGIAHELRNPLGSIKGVAQLLSENHEEERIRNYTRLIIGEVDRLDRVIRTLLDFSQPEPEEVVPTSLNSLLTQALSLASHHPSVEKTLPCIHIRQDLKDIPLCSVQKNRLTQAFTNIILNALQAVKPEGTVVIQSAGSIADNSLSFVEIQIINDGPVIPADIRDRIYEPFFTTRSGGTGLGLPISYQIIVSNGGSLDLDSEEGRTAFIIRFPAVVSGEGKETKSVSPLIRENSPSPKDMR